MTSQAKMATGSMVLYNGSVFAELTDITPPSFSIEKVDATSHDSVTKVSIPGLSSYGDLTFKANFVNDTTQAALRVLAINKTVGTWRFVYPPSSGLPTYSMSGFVSAYSQAAPLKSATASLSVTITPVESVTEITSAGTPMTGVVVIKSEGGTVSPTPVFNPLTYVYDYTMPLSTVASFTISPTSTATTIYVDGNPVTSGQPSNPISYLVSDYPSGSIKSVFVVCDTVNTKPVIYTLRFTRGTMLAAGSPSDPPVAPDYSLSNVVVTTDNEGVILPTSGAFSPRVDSHTYNLKRSTVSFTVTPTSLAEKILVDSQLVVSGNPIRIPMTMNDYPVGSGKTVFIRCTQKDVAKTYRLIFNRGAE